MANVKDDEFETLDFADEAEYAEGDPDDEDDGAADELDQRWGAERQLAQHTR